MRDGHYVDIDEKHTEGYENDTSFAQMSAEATIGPFGNSPRHGGTRQSSKDTYLKSSLLRNT